ncbi:MAG: nucleotidyltransferase family protein, partial [Myxococcota bacterium]
MDGAHSEHFRTFVGLIRQPDRFVPPGQAFFGWSDANRVSALAYRLTGNPGFRDARIRDAAQYLRLVAWLAPLLERAGRRKLSCALFKGLGTALTKGVYEAPDERRLGDLDLLVPPAQLSAWIELLAKEGFEPVFGGRIGRRISKNGYQVPLRHRDLGLVELHHRLYRDTPFFDVPSLIASADSRALEGMDVKVVGHEALFLILSAHLAVNEGSVPAAWFWEVAALSHALPQVEIPPGAERLNRPPVGDE